MNKNKFIALVAALMMVTSCADPDLGPIVTFDTAGKGAYAALLSDTDRAFNFFDLANSSYTYSIEFIDLEKGDLVSEYNVDLYYADNDPSNGDIGGGPFRVRSFSAADFTVVDSGNKGLTNISLSASDLIAAAGIDAANISAGDIFRIDGEVVTKDGQSFRRSNSSSTVNGGAFRGHLGFDLRIICPSSLEGEVDYSTNTVTWCDLGIGTGTASLVKSSGSTYKVDGADFDWGAYSVCYGPGGALPSGSLELLDDCNQISIIGESQWGEKYTINSLEVKGTELTMDWVNDYGEAGVTTLTRKDGQDWPALVKK